MKVYQLEKKSLYPLTAGLFLCLLVGLFTTTFSVSTVFASGIQESLGRDLVARSLNKRIIVTPRGTWTEHTGGNTGIDVITRVCVVTGKKKQKKYSKGFGPYSDKYSRGKNCNQ
jgi:hypothetical protein